jgi:hypothetical protein
MVKKDAKWLELKKKSPELLEEFVEEFENRNNLLIGRVAKAPTILTENAIRNFLKELFGDDHSG